ncbi:hypothetical protein DVK44_17030 [Streptomyces paludis]|uniref:Uncharacterized protein n=2 Tax=Streptomyces paludis TaxID=2282738 RepID=A0A345I137_9ACTN|nr:hypothetical protein DVK44_17030 [Streptomyces paludis]
MGMLFYPLLWLGMAFLAGPLFGVAGAWWRRNEDWRRRAVAVAGLAGVFGMESVHYAWTLHYAPQAWACLALAVLLPLVMPRTHKERGVALLCTAAFSFVAYVVVYRGLLSGA